MTTQIRVLRILEYVGDADAIMKTMESNAVKGSHNVAGKFIIREAILGSTPELLSTEENNDNNAK